MDVPGIISLRAPDCMRRFHPASLGFAAQNNAAYKSNLDSLASIFHNFQLNVTDVVEDLGARKICMWLEARADTVVGEYRNEYVWNMEFDEAGEQIVGFKEFVDAGMVRDFYPRLKEELGRRMAAGKEVEGKEAE